MKYMTVALVLALAVAVSAMPQINSSPKFIAILQNDDVRNENGEFTLRYVSQDGTKVSESGKLVPNAQGDDSVLVKEGTYTYISPEGKTYVVNYVADELGFRATGEHIPKA